MIRVAVEHLGWPSRTGLARSWRDGRRLAVFPQVIPEGEGPVKTNLCGVWLVLRASLSWLGASK